MIIRRCPNCKSALPFFKTLFQGNGAFICKSCNKKLVIQNKKSIPVVATAIFFILNRYSSGVFYSFIIFLLILIIVILSQVLLMPAKLLNSSESYKNTDEGMK
jgi:CXXC-20-CXXC protein